MARRRALGLAPRRPLASAGIALALGLTACQQTVAFERADASGAGGEGGFSSCGGAQPLQFSPEYPTVVVALDRSTSMSDPFPTGGPLTKLEAVRQALLAAAEHYQYAIYFSYLGFPGMATSSCFTECCSSMLTSFPGNIGDGGFSLFHDAVLSGCNDPKGNCVQGPQRPTAEALMSCQQFFSNPIAPVSPYGNNYVLLVTDGYPGCSNSSDPCYDAQPPIRGLTGLGVDVRVIGVGPPASDADACLGRLANTASGPYKRVGPNDLDTFDMILGDIATQACTLEVHGTSMSPPPDLMHIQVSQTNGTMVPRDSTEGWTVDGNNQRIFLHGTACDTFLLGGPKTTQLFNCPH
jgi:hypothetical protein